MAVRAVGRHSDFGFRTSFGLRISDFGFRPACGPRSTDHAALRPTTTQPPEILSVHPLPTSGMPVVAYGRIPHWSFETERAGIAMNRRDALKTLAAAGVSATFPGCSTPSSSSASNPVQRENLQLGTHDWMLTNTRIDAASKYRCPWIEG